MFHDLFQFEFIREGGKTTENKRLCGKISNDIELSRYAQAAISFFDSTPLQMSQDPAIDFQ